jgi:hypothetical protein
VPLSLLLHTAAPSNNQHRITVETRLLPLLCGVRTGTWALVLGQTFLSSTRPPRIKISHTRNSGRARSPADSPNNDLPSYNKSTLAGLSVAQPNSCWCIRSYVLAVGDFHKTITLLLLVFISLSTELLLANCLWCSRTARRHSPGGWRSGWADENSLFPSHGARRHASASCTGICMVCNQLKLVRSACSVC